jgi:hypothetical protein
VLADTVVSAYETTPAPVTTKLVNPAVNVLLVALSTRYPVWLLALSTQVRLTRVAFAAIAEREAGAAGTVGADTEPLSHWDIASIWAGVKVDA